MDRFAKYNALASAVRGQVCELELVTRLHMADGSLQEITNVRRAVCKKAGRKGNKTVLTFADIDTEALQKVFPFELFTVADFPGLFEDHVGWYIPQGVGTVVKVPLAWISSAGGVFQYAGPKILDPLNPPTVLAVYRGSQPGQGALVSASEYSQATATGLATGVLVAAINFAREQKDFSGRPYVLEADILIPGSRAPSDELKRILTLYGITADATTFTAAAAADTAGGFAIDALYGAGTKARTGLAIVNDLLNVARGWLSMTSAGAWAIVQDVAKASVAQFDTSPDLLQIDSYGDGDIEKTVAIDYRPKRSGEEEYAGTLSRTTTGATGERRIKCPYIRDHGVADRLLSYWQKRLNTLREASGTIYATQRANGDRVSVTDSVNWTGTKDFIITGISRPADSNAVKLREYDASIYVYTAGTLPADATNTYTPDYSYTPPLAPAFFALASTLVSADNDGKQTANASLVVVPGANSNWARLMVQLTDTTTNEQYQGEALLFSPGVYLAIIGGLRPNRLHSLVAWAVNANNIDGAVATAPNFTTASASIALAAPAITVSQKQSFFVDLDLGAVADVAGAPKLRRYVVFEKVGAGSFTEVLRTADRTIKRQVNHGTAYQYKAHAEDLVGNETADSNTVSITPAAVIDDTHINPGGVGTNSLGNGAVSQGKANTSAGSVSGTCSPGINIFGGVTYSFWINGGTTGTVITLQGQASIPSSDQALYVFNNPGASAPFGMAYRAFNP